MIPTLTTVNSIEDVRGYKIIADIITDKDARLFYYIYDSNIIVISIVDKNYINNRIFILTKVGDFYIKEKEIFSTDENFSNMFGLNFVVTKHDKDYVLAISDEDYLSENNERTGCVFLYKFISGKGWLCIKELSVISTDDKIKYSKFGNYLNLTDDGLIVGHMCNNEQNYFLYKTNDFKHFSKEVVNYSVEEPIDEVTDSDNMFFTLNVDDISDGKKRFKLKCGKT